MKQQIQRRETSDKATTSLIVGSRRVGPHLELDPGSGKSSRILIAQPARPRDIGRPTECPNQSEQSRPAPRLFGHPRRAREDQPSLQPQVFEDRVARALGSLGVPSKQDIDSLSKRVVELSAAVQALTEAKPAAKAA